MGAVYADIVLTNADDQAVARRGLIEPGEVRTRTVSALADSGATILVISEALRADLGLATVGQILVTVADGGLRTCDLAGPIELRYGDRTMHTDAAVMPGDVQVLLGQVQMEQLDLIIDPLARKLIANPSSPDRATLMAVGLRVHGTPPPAP